MKADRMEGASFPGTVAGLVGGAEPDQSGRLSVRVARVEDQARGEPDLIRTLLKRLDYRAKEPGKLSGDRGNGECGHYWGGGTADDRGDIGHTIRGFTVGVFVSTRTNTIQSRVETLAVAAFKRLIFGDPLQSLFAQSFIHRGEHDP